MRARHRAHERRVRTEVRRYSSCLDSLSDTERRFLTLRAGLEGPPQSRGAAADQAGIPRSEARGVEQRSLRELRSACGGASGSTTHTIADSTSRMPSFQPASLLVATGGTRPQQLVAQSELGNPGKQQVKGEHATSSPPPSHGEGPQEATITSHPLASASSGGIDALWIAILAALALMAAVAVVALRSRRGSDGSYDYIKESAAASTGPAFPVAAVPVAHEPEPEPEPEPAPEPEAAQPAPPTWVSPTPQQPQAQPRGRDYRKAARPAAMIASGIVSFAARELMRRRRGGRRRR